MYSTSQGLVALSSAPVPAVFDGLVVHGSQVGRNLSFWAALLINIDRCAHMLAATCCICTSRHNSYVDHCDTASQVV
eukprot:4558652-Pleurochrysis_carterae.AAC.2